MLLLPVQVHAAITFPSLTGRVVDQAGIFDNTTKARIDAILVQHEQKTSNQVVVVTLPSLQGLAIEEFGYQLGRAWGIGTKAKHNGVLLIVAPQERQVRIEVGYGLEGTLTDATSKMIIEQDILPHFKQGDYPGGILAGTTSILATIEGTAEAQPISASSSSSLGSNLFTLMIYLFLFFIFVSLRFVFSLFYFLIMTLLGKPLPEHYLRDSWKKSLRASRGGRSGFRSGGGGFRGGGGSFGGGGSSGRW